MKEGKRKALVVALESELTQLKLAEPYKIYDVNEHRKNVEDLTLTINYFRGFYDWMHYDIYGLERINLALNSPDELLFKYCL